MIFYRFGEIPKNEKSGIWKGEEKVGEEFGVSVYEAHKNINGHIPLLFHFRQMKRHSMILYII